MPLKQNLANPSPNPASQPESQMYGSLEWKSAKGMVLMGTYHRSVGSYLKEEQINQLLSPYETPPPKDPKTPKSRPPGVKVKLNDDEMDALLSPYKQSSPSVSQMSAQQLDALLASYKESAVSS